VSGDRTADGARLSVWLSGLVLDAAGFYRRIYFFDLFGNRAARAERETAPRVPVLPAVVPTLAHLAYRVGGVVNVKWAEQPSPTPLFLRCTGRGNLCS
jgi:hypothetical protein